MTISDRTEALLAMFVGALIMILLATAVYFVTGYAHARPNDIWLVQKRAAERCENQPRYECEETLRRLHYLSTAGYVLCIPGTYCFEGGTQISCCGEADAYEADETFVDSEGRTWAVLTCNDPKDCQEVPGKFLRAPGERYLVPPERVLLRDRPTNNTGHGWVWINPNTTNADGSPSVLCWAAPSGL